MIQIAKFKLILEVKKTVLRRMHTGNRFYVEFYIRMSVNSIFVFFEILRFEIRFLKYNRCRKKGICNKASMSLSHVTGRSLIVSGGGEDLFSCDLDTKKNLWFISRE